MKKTTEALISCAAALLLCAVTGRAQQAPVPQPLPAAATAQQTAPVQPPVKYSDEMRATLKDLSLLLDRGGEVPQARLDALIPELKKFRADVRAAIGGEILGQEAAKEDLANSEAAKKILQGLRSTLQIYYIENNGRYPKSLSDLVPMDIQAIPELQLPGHARTAEATVVNSRKFDKDISKAVTDTGGWLYFSDPHSANYGLLVINCSHREPGGAEFYKY